MKYSNTITSKTKSLILKNNGKVVDENILLDPDQINWSYKGNQTRSGDLDLGHKAALSADIDARGLIDKPLVEFDPQTEQYNPVSGHHRLSVLRSKVETSKTLAKIPCASIKFGNEIDREFFMQGENDHPPTKAHTRADATRFIKNMRNYGHFDSAEGDEETLKEMCFELLESHYCRLNTSKKEDVFHEAFKDRKMTRVLKHTKEDVKSLVERCLGKRKGFKWQNGNYLAWGDTNSARKAVAVALEKRVHDLDKGKVKTSGARGKVSVVTHFSSKGIVDLEQLREDFLKTEELLNKHAYGPGKVIIIDEVSFLPQVEGKKGVKETKLVRYKWNYETEKFNKK
jgi:hypothetical protein